MQGLGYLPGAPDGSSSAAYAASDDGSIVVGNSHNSAGIGEAFRWQNNAMTGLGGYFSTALALSADGSMIVGDILFDDYYHAVLWNNDLGMRRIEDVLVDDFDVDLAGWHLYEAMGVSADGKVIVGNGVNPDGNIEGWVARLHQPRKIVIAFGHDAFVSISAITNAAGQTITYANLAGTHPAYTEQSAAFESFKGSIRDQVEEIFRSSQAETIEVVIGGIDPEASNIFFADRDVIPPTTLLGQAYTGIDQFDRELSGEAFVMLGAADIGDPAAEKLIAETIAHEGGHLMGLIHIDPPGAESVMDYDIPAMGTNEVFVNGAYPCEEPPGSGNVLPGVTHNELYHLLRYVEGRSHDELVSAGIQPGSWDLMSMPPLDVGMDFQLSALVDPSSTAAALGGDPLPDTLLYDVFVLESQAAPDEAVLLDFFEEDTLADLAAPRIKGPNVALPRGIKPGPASGSTL